MPIVFSQVPRVPADAEVVAAPVLEGPHLPEGPSVQVDLDRLEKLGFQAKVGQAQALVTEEGLVVAVGMGKAEDVTAETFRRAAAALVPAAGKAESAATTMLEALPPGLDAETAAQAMAEGTGMAAYHFGAYKSDSSPCRLQELSVVAPDGVDLGPALQRGSRVAGAVCLARDLVNEPAGSMTPSRLAEMATEIAEREGLQVTVLDEVAIAEQGLGGLMGVARGSAEPPRLIELVYDPPGVEGPPTLALVGKGVTFDSGGLSIKTAEGMMTMKTDMSGAAAVIAAISALPALAPPVRVVGIVPTTENMPGGRATKPGDVLRARNGKTIEVLNTDAEGRLILADGLSMAAEAGPAAIVDVATLTGAQIVALGKKIAAVMGNNEGVVAQVRAAADRAGEPVWPLPLPEEYKSHMDSEVADLKNIGRDREAGTIIGGLFLEEFVGGVPWAHVDIAGPARSDSDDGYLKKGGTGFGVRTLVELAMGFQPPAATGAQAASGGVGGPSAVAS